MAPKSRATGNGEKIPRAPRSIPRRNVFSWFSRYTSIHMESNGTQERRQVTRDRKSISFSRSVCRRDRFESVGKVEVAEMAAMSRPGVGREARTGPRVNGSLRPFVVCVVCEHIDAQIEVRYEARSPSRATFSL